MSYVVCHSLWVHNGTPVKYKHQLQHAEAERTQGQPKVKTKETSSHGTLCMGHHSEINTHGLQL